MTRNPLQGADEQESLAQLAFYEHLRAGCSFLFTRILISLLLMPSRQISASLLERRTLPLFFSSPSNVIIQHHHFVLHWLSTQTYFRLGLYH